MEGPLSTGTAVNRPISGLLSSRGRTGRSGILLQYQNWEPRLVLADAGMSSGTNEVEGSWEEGFWLEYRVEEKGLSRKALLRTTRKSRRVRTSVSWAVRSHHIQCLI